MNMDKDQALNGEPIDVVDDLVFEDLEERNVQLGWECGCTSTSDCCCCCIYTF